MASDASWSEIKKELVQLNQQEILSLLKGEVILDDYEARIYTAFFSRSKYGRPSDLRNYVDLQLYYIETGTSLTRQHDDMYESFYGSLLSVMEDVVKALMRPENHTLYTYFLPRLQHLYRDGDGFGWGYTDELHSHLESYCRSTRRHGCVSQTRLATQIFHAIMPCRGATLRPKASSAAEPVSFLTQGEES